MDVPITQHFTLEELYRSKTADTFGINNKPSAQQQINLTYLAEHILEPLRVAMGEPIPIGSGFRCQALNKAVGGVYNSQHMKGEAADINIEGDLGYGKRIFTWIKNHCQYDQLIWEHNPKTGSYWVHVSFVFPDFGKNRRHVIDGLIKK